MSAANTDKFKKLARKWVGQVGAGGVATAVASTVPLASSTNLPTDTAVVAVIDRVDANGTKTPSVEETVIGVVSGTDLVSCIRGAEGTAQTHIAGAVVEILITAKGINDLIDGILVEHGQDGTHDKTKVVDLTTAQTLTNKTLTSPKVGTAILDTNGNEVIKTPAVTNAVNEVTVTPAATGGNPTISATGGDDNINLKVNAKGSAATKISAIRQEGTSSPSTTYTHNTVIQSGWGFVTGNGSSTTSKAVTFPVAFSVAPVVTVTALGLRATSAGSPTGTDFFTSGSAMNGRVNAQVSTTGFTVILSEEHVATLDNTNNYGFCWIAIGELA